MVHFFDLPAELRIQIYDIIAAPDLQEDAANGTISPSLALPLDHTAQVAQVNHQMRREYLPIYHSKRRLRLYSGSASDKIMMTNKWLAVFGDTRLRLHKDLRVFFGAHQFNCHFVFGQDGSHKVNVKPCTQRGIGRSQQMTELLQRHCEEVLERNIVQSLGGRAHLTKEAVEALREGAALASIVRAWMSVKLEDR